MSKAEIKTQLTYLIKKLLTVDDEIKELSEQMKKLNSLKKKEEEALIKLYEKAGIYDEANSFKDYHIQVSEDLKIVPVEKPKYISASKNYIKDRVLELNNGDTEVASSMLNLLFSKDNLEEEVVKKLKIKESKGDE